MDFITLQREVANQLKLNLDDSDVATLIKRWINQTYQDVSGRDDWPWLRKHALLQTVTEITTGTVSINSADTTATFSSAPTVSTAGYFIQFAGTDDWYEVTAHTASATTATITPSYGPSTNASAVTYTLRKVYYSLGSTVDRILGIRQSRTPAKLKGIDVRTFDTFLPDPAATGNPTIFYDFGLDSSGNHRVVFYPTPSAVINMTIRHMEEITELSANGDTPNIPPKFRYSLVWGSLHKGFAYLGDEGKTKSMFLFYEDAVKIMKSKIPINQDIHHVMRRFDDLPAGGLPFVPFPPEYGTTGR